jgi:receptor-interacting serine/threonine-protein kinase 3
LEKSEKILLVTEFMEQGSLKDLLHKYGTNIDFKLKTRLLLDAASGMKYLHSHDPPVVHRDLKPSNLLIDKKWHCKIADFGISKVNVPTLQTQSLVGTPAYMAPEILREPSYIPNPKADVYSFGMTNKKILLLKF